LVELVANRCKTTGRVAEQMGDLEHALSACENALRHNPMSLAGLTQVAGIARIKENYPKVKFLIFFFLIFTIRGHKRYSVHLFVHIYFQS